MTISLETWHVLLALLAGAGWLYVQWIAPVQKWRKDKDVEIAKLTLRVETAEAALAKGDAAFDRFEALLRDHEREARNQMGKVLERMAALEVLMKERSIIPNQD